MRLRNFLVGIGIWVALLPHFGFSILAENVLFSITGFLLIISSFYVAAVEDKHKHKRVIQGETIEDVTHRVNGFFKQIKNPLKRDVVEREKIVGSKDTPQAVRRDGLVKEFPKAVAENEQETIVEADDGRPRIRKAVSDVKIKIDSIDDIVS